MTEESSVVTQETTAPQVDVHTLLTQPLGETVVPSEAAKEAMKPEVKETQAKPEPADPNNIDAIFQDPEKGLNQYKNLQSAFNKRDTEIREVKAYKDTLDQKFARVGGADKAVQTMEYLLNNPRFQEFMRTERGETTHMVGGVDLNTADDSTKQAMNIVQKTSDEIAEQKLQEFKRQHLAPLETEVKQQQIKEVFSQMDKAHPGWDKYKDAIGQQSKMLVPNLTDRPTFETVQMLYNMALMADGKVQTAQTVNQEIDNRTDLSNDAPSGARMGTPIKEASNIYETFELAKQSRG